MLCIFDLLLFVKINGNFGDLNSSLIIRTYSIHESLNYLHLPNDRNY